ncbi:hemopexin repeat-containing protein [Zooshikella ganghwensis]|uniref:Tc toxin subunit A-related protein n=1 Tax=Zooshikella ganghwensis TaxID=202772 RepID=UPI000428ED51|nr:hemopexin repeat-containing protein [Zooshikella ganghwensis]
MFAGLPENFKGNIDAAVASDNGGTYFFKGDQFINSSNPDKICSIAEVWGKEKIDVKTLEKADAAYAFEGKWYLFSGEHIFAYRDCIENEGLEILEGYPKKISDYFGEKLPAKFHRDIDAALIIANSSNITKLYLFHDDEFVVGSLDRGNSEAGETGEIGEIGETGEAVEASEDGKDSVTKLWTFNDPQSVSIWGAITNLLEQNGIDATLSGLDGRTYIFSGEQYYRYSGKDYFQADPGYPRSVAEDWAGLNTVEAAFTWNGATYIFGEDNAKNKKYVRYSTNNYKEVDKGFPKPQEEKKTYLWNLPTSFKKKTKGKGVDAIFNAPDGKTYLFSGSDFIYYDETNRWWSECQLINENWKALGDSSSVKAAFTGKDQKTYIFVKNSDGLQYYRFSDADYCKPDIGYPRPVGSFWGNIKNQIADCNRVDAAVSLKSRELKEKDNGFFDLKETNHTYVFCRDQFYRYKSDTIQTKVRSETKKVETSLSIEAGYPKPISQLMFEQRFQALKHTPEFMGDIADGIDAVMSDERNVYLFKDSKVQILSDHCHADIHHFNGLEKAIVMENGEIFGIGSVGESGQTWRHISSLEGTGGIVLGQPGEMPAWLADIKKSENEIDAVLQGTDHNTYVFTGKNFLNKQLNREYKIASYWGKVRNNIEDNNHVDAAFIGVDKKLYLFSGDQFYIYAWDESVKDYKLYLEPGNKDDTGVHSIAEHWGGLDNVQVAYQQGDKTYLCEQPDSTGSFRYQCYRGSDYSKPLFNTPQYAGPELWDMPKHLVQQGWGHFDTVFIENNHVSGEQTLIFIKDRKFLQYNVAGAHWFEPKPLENLWPKIPCHHEIFDKLETAFIDPAGKAHFFGNRCYVTYSKQSNALEEELAISSKWGQLSAISKIDAAFVSLQGKTYLFSGEHYIRYSHADYCHVDAGYPKRVAEHLRSEPGFENLPKNFEVDAKSNNPGIQGIVSNSRNTYVLMNNKCYVSSEKNHTQLSLNSLMYRRNNLLINPRIDAALLIPGNTAKENKTYLFSGDQYFRYTGKGCKKLEDGYPKRIGLSLAGELSSTINPWFYKGIDAAVRCNDGSIYLFKNGKYQKQGDDLEDISKTWGKRSNPFLKDQGYISQIDAAFIDADSGLIAIKGDQVVRYADTEQEYIEPGYPKALTDLFHQLPDNYQNGVNSAFTYAGRLYLLKKKDKNKENQTTYIRYPANLNKEGHFECHGFPEGLSPYYPTTFADHWSDCGDFRLYDLQRIFRYKELQNTYSGEHTLLDVIRQSGGYAKDPYGMLADIFGWNSDDIKWLKRNNKLQPTDRDDERHFKLEEIENQFDILALREKLDAKVEDLYKCWNELFGESKKPSRAADQLLQWLQIRHTGSSEGQILDSEIHNKLNLMKRDALLEYSIHYCKNHQDEQYEDARDVYEDLLIDVKMGEIAETSRVKEAISALQLYFHRFFINLEEGNLKNTTDPVSERESLKEHWEWMKNYRVWEANRKVFLYPENYIRPELRDSKTPEFKTLEQNLLQGKLSEENIEKVFSNYIDDYTEVSGLKIAGGYAYDKEANKEVLLFGKTKEEPKKYYYRKATFIDGKSDNIQWKPWQEVQIQIGSDKVYPVYALNRFYVFWAEIEKKGNVRSDTNVSVSTDDDNTDIKSDAVIESVLQIYFSYQKSSGGWSAPQKLNYEITSNDFITDYYLSFSGQDKAKSHGRESIIVSCYYNSEKRVKPKLNAQGVATWDAIKNVLELQKGIDQQTDETVPVFIKHEDSTNINLINYKTTVEKDVFTHMDTEGQYFYVDRVIPGDNFNVPLKRGESVAENDKKFKLVIVEAKNENKNYVSFKSIENEKESYYMRHHADRIVLHRPDEGDSREDVYNADTSFSVQKGLIGDGYTIYSIVNDGSVRVLYFDRNGCLWIRLLSEINSLQEKRNATFNFLVDRSEEVGQFTFYPETFEAEDLHVKEKMLSNTKYCFDIFKKLFPKEDYKKLSSPVLLNNPQSDTSLVWSCFDYKGSSFLCKPRSGRGVENNENNYTLDLTRSNSNASEIVGIFDKNSKDNYVVFKNGLFSRFENKDGVSVIELTETNKIFPDKVSNIKNNGLVTSSFVKDEKLYMISDDEYICYDTRLLNSTRDVGVDYGYPKSLSELAAELENREKDEFFGNKQPQSLSYFQNKYIWIKEGKLFSAVKGESSLNEERIDLWSTEVDDLCYISNGEVVYTSGGEIFKTSKSDFEAYLESTFNGGEKKPDKLTNDLASAKSIYLYNDFVHVCTNVSKRRYSLSIINDSIFNIHNHSLLDIELYGNYIFTLSKENNTNKTVIHYRNKKGDNSESGEKNKGAIYLNGFKSSSIYFDKDSKLCVRDNHGRLYSFKNEMWKEVVNIEETSNDKYQILDKNNKPMSNDVFVIVNEPKYKSGLTGRKINYLLSKDRQLFAFSEKEYIRCTNTLDRIDEGYPKLIENISGNDDLKVPTDKDDVNSVAYVNENVLYFLGNGKFVRVDTEGNTTKENISDKWGAVNIPNNVHAAFKLDEYIYIVDDGISYKFKNNQLSGDNWLIDIEFKEILGNHFDWSKVKGTFVKEDSGIVVLLLRGNNFVEVDLKRKKYEEKSYKLSLEIPESCNNFSSSFTWKGENYFIVENEVKFFDSKLYEDNVLYDIVRLSSSTGSTLSQNLFAKGVAGLLSRSSQVLDETPSFNRESIIGESEDKTVILCDPSKVNLLPVNTHLDFNGANGQYYWEMFYHAPSLIANSLNTAQKFEEAKRWYEFIFDPTDKQDYWKFLPFLAVDVKAITDELESFSTALTGAKYSPAKKAINDLVNELVKFAPALRGDISLSEEDLIKLNKLHKLENGTFTTWSEVTNLEAALKVLEVGEDKRLKIQHESAKELVDIIKRLPIRYNLMVAYGAEQIQAYLDDPFDPHAIANLRRIAYRRTTVMAYIDNLLDWGDALFRQYTHETINEARMLYVLAYDLLGKKLEYLGEKALSPEKSYYNIKDLGAEEDSSVYDFLFDSPKTDSADITSFTHAGIVHESVGNPYFYVPENTELLKYWERIEDRLHKIRNSLNILGIKQPLPLFQPPIDPMALVNAAASGAGISAAVAGLNMPVPHYRFNFMLNKARELTGKVTQFGNDLLGNIEKKEAEELSLLQNKQESAIQDISRDIKEAQLREAKENLKNLEESKKSAEKQRDHYQGLKDQGKLPEEQSQIDLITHSRNIQIAKPILEAAAAVVNAIPDVHIGPPFASNVKTGGSLLGPAMQYAATALGSTSEILSTSGEIAGLEAQFLRTVEEWDIQLLMAKSEIIQLEYQIEGAKWSIKSAEQELVVHDKEVEHTKSMNTFMKEKFSNEQLYQWMTSKLSKLFFQTYQMAYDLAKGAEKAYIYENGLPASEVNFIGSTYWDSLHKGLMSGDQLAYDLDRLEKYAIDNNSRGFEITKTISLAELDPIAFLKLKDKKECEFAFTEELFDYDFPGHYNRQIKTVAIKFVAGEGKVVNATLTQLSNKIVMKPDIKAVKYLINLNEEQPLSIRSDWRPTQQIAASQPDPYSENSSGLFEVNFGDDRYLPFEGTGAVSRWRLELGGKKGSYELGEISDVQIEIQYTAMQGGKAFADAVKGMLKPYDTAVHIDFATTFPNEFFAWVNGETEDMEIVMTQDRFPNISGSKLTAVYPLFEVKEGGQVSMTINDDSSLTLRSGKLLLTNALTVSKRGDVWRFSAKGNKADLVNAALVFSYKASVV